METPPNLARCESVDRDDRCSKCSNEEGDLVLEKADATKHTELRSIKAIEGRTWNHPVRIDNRIYIRNSQEAACYELPTASEPVASLQ